MFLREVPGGEFSVVRRLHRGSQVLWRVGEDCGQVDFVAPAELGIVAQQHSGLAVRLEARPLPDDVTARARGKLAGR